MLPTRYHERCRISFCVDPKESTNHAFWTGTNAQWNIDIGDFEQCQHRVTLTARPFQLSSLLAIMILSRRSETMKSFEMPTERVG